ncbi:MAG: putative quinol monooxygenase [Gemmataceae bacterium]
MLLAVVMGLSLVGFAGAADEKAEPDLPTRLKNLPVPEGKPFTLIVHLQVKKGQEAALLKAARPAIIGTRKEPGCVAYELHQDLEHPTRFVFFEKWKTVEDLRQHLQMPYLKTFGATLGKATEGPNKFAFYLNSDDK